MKTLTFSLALFLLATGCALEEETEAEVVVEVRTEVVRSEEIQATKAATASIFPRSEAQVASPLTAAIQQLKVRKGDRVRNGQPLAQLVKKDLEAQRAEVTAQVAGARANLEKITSGTLPTDIERARGDVEKATAALAEAQQIYEQRQMLFQEGAIPERELLVSTTRFEQARTDQRVAKKLLDLLLRRSRDQDLRMAQSRLEQARSRLDYIQTQLEYALIRSPSDGVITQQFLYPGDMAKPDSPIFTVVDLSVAVARGQFPESRATALRQGQVCWFQALDSPQERLSGTITVVNQAVDPLRRTVEVWCEIPNRGGPLKAGAFGRLTVVTETRPNATTVAPAAVQFEEGTHQGVVWTVGRDSLPHSRQVTTGVVSKGRVEIISGLRPGERVVVEGGYGLADNVKVRIVEPSGSEPSQ